MNETLWYIGGVVFLLIGIMVSIGLHEFGHMIPAKIFGVRVPRYAIGFGPKLFKKKIGETEYSFNLIPLGGFITMIGMYPPNTSTTDDSKRRFGSIISQARTAHSEFVEPGDEARMFYRLPMLKRVIVMLGGPFMNLILAILFFAVAFTGIGTWQETNGVNAVIPCVAQMQNSQVSCTSQDARTPAALAGLKPSDSIVTVDGVATSDAAAVRAAIASLPIRQHALKVRGQGGAERVLSVTPKLVAMPLYDSTTGEPAVDSHGNALSENRPIIGIQFEVARTPQPLSMAFDTTGQSIGATAQMIGQLPAQLGWLVVGLFEGHSRAANSPVSIVGIGQMAGQAASAPNADLLDKLASNLFLLGSLNVALFTFNLVPLLPLDGGHIASVVYEAIKRGVYRVRKKAWPGPVDTARLAPLSQAVFLALFLMGIIVIIADFASPVATR
jgi:membrane-associated protease RseP (regulator of RpoE activity)